MLNLYIVHAVVYAPLQRNKETHVREFQGRRDYCTYALVQYTTLIGPTTIRHTGTQYNPAITSTRVIYFRYFLSNTPLTLRSSSFTFLLLIQLSFFFFGGFFFPQPLRPFLKKPRDGHPRRPTCSSLYSIGLLWSLCLGISSIFRPSLFLSPAYSVPLTLLFFLGFFSQA